MQWRKKYNMDLMKQKLIRTFFETWEIDKLIATGQLPLDEGVPVLRNMVKEYLRPDIKLIDSNAYNALMEAVNQVSITHKEHKQMLNKNIRTDDEIDERNKYLKLLAEDHNRYHKELKLMQELFDRKQWFIMDKDIINQ